jgi:L-threonylcarbamoyladenylate synthase
METRLIQPSAGNLTAVKLLQGGHLVAFPTDTVYGLGAQLFNPQAIEKLLRLKKENI